MHLVLALGFLVELFALLLSTGISYDSRAYFAKYLRFESADSVLLVMLEFLLVLEPLLVFSRLLQPVYHRTSLTHNLGPGARPLCQFGIVLADSRLELVKYCIGAIFFSCQMLVAFFQKSVLNEKCEDFD